MTPEQRTWTLKRGVNFRIVVDGPEPAEGEEIEVVETSRAAGLQEALEALYGMAINGVVCDPHHKPCNLCKDIFEMVRAALEGQ